MCGIAGIHGYGPGAQTDERELVALRDAQTHRGPDDAGLWLANDARVGLGHRRLTIIDLSPQGIEATCGLLRVVFPEAHHITPDYLNRL